MAIIVIKQAKIDHYIPIPKLLDAQVLAYKCSLNTLEKLYDRTGLIKVNLKEHTICTVLYRGIRA